MSSLHVCACFILRLCGSTVGMYPPVTDSSASSRHRRSFHCRGRSFVGALRPSRVLARLMEMLSRTDVLVLLGTLPPTFRSSTFTIHQAAVHSSNRPLCSLWNIGVGPFNMFARLLLGVVPELKIAIIKCEGTVSKRRTLGNSEFQHSRPATTVYKVNIVVALVG